MKLVQRIRNWLTVITRIPAVVCRRCGRLIAFISVLVLVYILVYLFWRTPLPVYTLDRLNLRPFFLPDIACLGCNNFTYPYMVENSKFCTASGRNRNASISVTEDGKSNAETDEIFLLILVATFHANADARRAIRKAWGSVREYRGKLVRTLFMFGYHDDPNFNYLVRYELERYGDVIQVMTSLHSLMKMHLLCVIIS